jgi:hypothetical protein
MEVFPDLHHKMSKKIAQLTKVIYHLNTKNEDHALEIEQLNSNHQMEVQQILRDAANRISKFKEALEAKQAAANNEKALEKLQKKHELERAAAQQQLNELKQKTAEREQKIAAEFQTKLEQLRKEIEGMNNRFRDKIDGFEALNAELKKSLEDANRSGSASADELRKKYEIELAELVKSSNEKYQQMLVEQLGIQEALKRDSELKLNAERKQLSDKYQSDLDRELGQLRAKLAADKQESMLSLRHELEEKLNQQKTDFLSKMDKLINDLQQKSQDFDKLQTSSTASIRSLEDKISILQKSIQDQAGGSQAQIAQLTEDLLQMREANATMKAKIVQREEEINSLQFLLNSKNEMLAKLETSVQQQEMEIHRLNGELQISGKTGARVEEELKSRLAAVEKEAASYRNEINTMGNSLNAMKEDLKRSKDQATATQLELENKLKSLQSDYEMLQRQLRDASSSLSQASISATEEISKLRQQIGQLEDSTREEKRQLMTNNQQLLDQMKDKHRQDIDNLEKSKQALSEAFVVKEQAILADIARQRDMYEGKLSELQTEHKRVVDELTVKHQEEVDSLKTTINELENQIQSLSDSNDAEKQSLKNEFSKLDTKYKSVLKDLDARKKENERNESVTNGLKTQIENLREELKASQKAFREKMDISTAKLEAEWQAKLESEIARLTRERQQLQEDLTTQFQYERKLLITNHEEEIRSLKSLLQKEAGDAANQLVSAERLRETLEATLLAEKNARNAQVQELHTSHQQAMKALEDKYTTEIDRLKREWKSSTEQKEQLLMQSHAAEVERLQRQIASNSEEAAASLARAIESERLDGEQAVRRALLQQEQDLTAEKKTALQNQQNEFDGIKSKLQQEHESAMGKIGQELESFKSRFADAQAQIATLQAMLTDERQERHRREEQFILERDSLMRDNEIAVRKEKELAEREMLKVMERHEVEIKGMRMDAQQLKQSYEERLREVAHEYKLLEDRYLARESRPEDVARIRDLEREMIEKDELVAKTREEMMYFKREMLNREDNYNQKFNRQPNVGVMQVIKPKEESSGKAKPTQMRVINPQGGNMVGGGMPGMGMGMGGGMGIGNGPPLGASGFSANQVSMKSAKSLK